MKDCEMYKNENNKYKFCHRCHHHSFLSSLYFEPPKLLLTLASHSGEIVGPVAQKLLNANPGLTNNLGFNFLHPNQSLSHNLKVNEKMSPIYNPKAKIL